MSRLERLAPLSGIVAVVLWVIAIVLLDRNESSVLGDSDTATAAQIAAFLKSEKTTIYVGTIIFAIGSVAFVWFLGVLRERLAAGPGGLGAWGFGSGVLAVATIFGFLGLRLAAASAFDMRPAGISDQTAEALFTGMDGFFVMTWFALGGFFLATGVAALRSRVLPRWLAWITIALGVLSLVVWTGWISEFLLAPWLVLVSVLLLRRAPGALDTGTL